MPSNQLLSLTVQGLGVITDVTLDFDEGFTVITGETGAGKTLLVDALSLCLGGESRSPRRGDELNVTALFLDAEGHERSLQRTVTSGQRLRAVIDGVPTSSEALRSIGEHMLVIHGQHDSLRLRSKSEIVRLIDQFGGIDTTRLEGLRGQLADLRRQRDSLGGNSSERERQLDFARFEVSEIEAARIQHEGELDECLAELVALTALRDQMVEIQAVVAQGEGDGGLESFVEVVSRLSTDGEVGDARRRILDLVSAIRDELSSVSHLVDPERLDESRFKELESRVDVLRALARKYGGSLSDVLRSLSESRELINTLANAEDLARSIDEEIEKVNDLEQKESLRIRTLRDAAALAMQAAISEQLPNVALPNAEVSLRVDGADGSEVDLVFTPNPGAPGGSIQNIASGGELSRVLLAISLVTSSDGLVTVFDEIDAGVGGNVAESIGSCLARLAATRQVIAVTHLASVAARANHHFVVEKHVTNGVTRTSIRAVSGSERVGEIARMLAGGSASTESRALAERLLAR